MTLNDLANRVAAHRDTPLGRQYELKVISADCFILMLGSIGLAIWFPPLVYATAVGHLIMGFTLSPARWFWLVSSPIIIAVASTIVLVGTYAVQHFYFGVPEAAVSGDLKAHWILFVAIAIVMGGIVSNLLSYAGNLGELVEYKNRDAMRG